jgi:hypothetical protein
MKGTNTNMITRLLNKLSVFIAGAMLLALPLAVPAMASAATDTTIQNNVCGSVDSLSINGTGDCTSTATGTDKVNGIITTIITLFSVIVGIIAVIMIVYGGLRYITSGGDSTKITSAKNTIIYALIGLVVVALAQFIVKFVLNKVTQ